VAATLQFILAPAQHHNPKEEAMPKDIPDAPNIGDPVVWFPHGDVNQEPFAATVTARMNSDCITLYTLSPTGRREPMLNVKHVDHPDHEKSPQGLKRWGAWDIVGEHEKRKESASAEAEERKREAVEEAGKVEHIDTDYSDSPDEIESTMIRLARELGDSPGRAAEIAQRIGSGMTHQRVNSVLRRFPHMLTGPITDEVAGMTT